MEHSADRPTIPDHASTGPAMRVAGGTAPAAGMFSPLPPALTSFVGREDLAASIESILRQRSTRMLTLTGPGGGGKTRLALHVASRLDPAYPDGIGFFPLADIRDPTLVLPTIASRLGIREGNRQSLLDRTCATLGDRTSLLVLDNFEHVVTAAPLLVEIASRCPGVSLLVTSRTPLHVSGEQVIPVPPLGLPPRGGDAEVVDSEAIQLFLARAEAIRPDLTVTEATKPAIAEICRRLDGLPLAIELAAARTALLPLPAMLERLTRRLPLLTSGPRDQPARLQTMHGAIAWSYDLLLPAEQALFRQFSAFVGGFSLAAAVAVSGSPEEEVLTGLEALVDHSLVRAVIQAVEEPRYVMLETIREFGLDQLAGSGEEDAVRVRHASYLVDLAERIDPVVDQASQASLVRLDLDRPNVLAALTWLTRRQNAHDALRLTAAMWRYWRIRGFLSEGRDQLSRALGLPGEAAVTTRAEALWKLGYLEFYLGEDAAAREHMEASAALFEAAGDRQGLATAIDALGAVLRFGREPGLAEQAHRRALVLRRDLNDEFGQAMPLASLGMLALDRGATADARSLLEQALQITIDHGSHREIAYRMLNLAQLELACNNIETARDHANRALGDFDTIGDLVATTAARDTLGRIESKAGFQDAAADHFLGSLRLRLRLGLHRDLTDIVERLAIVVLPQDAFLAAQVMSAAESSRATHGPPRLDGDEPAWQEAIADAHATLGPARFDQAWQRGRTLDIPAAARRAESHLASLAPGHGQQEPEPIPSPPAETVLTARELEVLRLVAAGHTNRVIAATLYISPATAKRHVTNILTKLDLPTRAAAISYALRNGLIAD